jgi:hypothetical protein
MRKILFSSVILFVSTCLCAQTGKSPFAKLGYKKQVMYTLSKGEFEEFHDRKNVVEIGTVLFNTKTKQIVGFVSEEKEQIEVSAATPAMSIDPLCEKYPWISPYAYCLNNPVRYTDPTGMWIVGMDGKAVTYKDGQWSPNASADVQKVGNAMMKTETGTKHLNEMLSPKNHKISIKVSLDVVKNGNKYDLGLTDNKAGKDGKGNLVVKESKITIYEGSIEELTSGGNNELKGLSMEDAIGVVAGHEKGHTEKENIKQSYENNKEGANHDVEARPIEIEKAILDEINKRK